METVIELKNGEYGKHYGTDGQVKELYKDFDCKITVDSDRFIHSYNNEPGFIRFYNYVTNTKSIEIWYKHGKYDNLSGCAINRYFKDGERMEIETNRINMLNDL